MQIEKNEYLVIKSNGKYVFNIDDTIKTDFMSLYIHNKDTKEDKKVEDENITVNIKSYVYHHNIECDVLEKDTLSEYTQNVNVNNILDDVLSIMLNELKNNAYYLKDKNILNDMTNEKLLNDVCLEFEIKNAKVLDTINDYSFNSIKVLEYVFTKYILALEIKINNNYITTEY